MIDKTQHQIMQNWENTDQIIVSITCVAYNHAYCIVEALDSFLMQETTFPFEILINDDASTDRTQQIIKEYEAKFPKIVKPVYQCENQFSQGINTMAILFPNITGKYVAFCDGDDYWIDNHKLEVQVGDMEKTPSVDMCFHPAYQLVKNKRSMISSRHTELNKIFTTQEVILGGGVFCPTSSLLFRNTLTSSLPDWFYTAIPGDFVAQIMGASRGGALYIDKCMSIYRVGVESSWTSSGLKENSQKRKNVFINFKHQLNVVNTLYHYKFQNEIDQIIYETSLDFIKTRRINVSVREDVYWEHKDTFPISQKLIWYLLYRNQNLLNSLKLIIKIKNKLLGGI